MGDVKTKDITGFGTVANAVASVTNNVINKISHAVGVIYNDSTHKIKKESLRKVYEEIANNENIDPFSKMAIISNLKQDLKYYKNQRNIISQAINNISDDANVDLVDDDWLNFFFDKAKNISSEDTQKLWAKILSEEFNRPRSIPKSLIQTIYIMDYETAKVFNNICKFVLEIDSDDKYVPFLLLYEFQDELKEYNITFDTLYELEKYGLIYSSFGSEYCTTGVKHNINIEIDGCTIVLEPNKNEEISNGNILLSNDGKALYKCMVTEKSKLLIKMINLICKEHIVK